MVISRTLHMHEPNSYPQLRMNYWGLVVLFTNKRSGTVVSLGSADRKHIHAIGEHMSTWELEAFVPLPKGSIISLTQG